MLLFALPLAVFGQISPGELSLAHQKLEGLSNCTQCHVLGEKVTNQKCLACHDEIQDLISNGNGYHASVEVRGKDCFACHSEHHGRNFRMIRLDEANFDHDLTSYKLEGKHLEIKCADCHQAKNIQQASLKEKKGSFLGLAQNCLSCHEDYHQKTLPADCASCHGADSFKPALNFDHQKTDFKLTGKHQQVACEKCHPKTEQQGKAFQQFSGVKFANCTSCHADVHQNKFGQNCTSCHNESSFHQVAGLTNCDHQKTNFPLEAKHRQIGCRSCHQQSLTAPLAHDKCRDCHQDYHNGQFSSQPSKPDCSACHDVTGFAASSFTIEKHNQSKFKLEGAHLATPCFACHKKESRWEFRKIGENCVDCHENIHREKIAEKYMPQQNCQPCHNVLQWSDIDFDHQETGFQLIGKHAKADCRSCHFKEEVSKVEQVFSGLSKDCESCHRDIHRGQFQVKGKTNCANCHQPNAWTPSYFDHDKSRFKLEGQHAHTACVKCHPPVQDQAGTFTKYNLKNEIKCADCHY